jgi:colicin import membrane protein
VHVLLAIFLIYGIRWQTRAPEAVEVELVRALPPMASHSSPVPPTEPTEIKPEPRPEPKIEAKPLPPTKPDIAIKDKPKPVKAAPKPEPSDAFQKQLQQEQDQRAESKKIDEASAELARLKAARDKQEADRAAVARNKTVADYVSKIRSKIRGNIVLPSEVKGNPEAVFDVTQLPSGEVISVKLRQSSGSSLLDTAIERAILKSSPLPKPDQGDVFQRSLTLHVHPLDD